MTIIRRLFILAWFVIVLTTGCAPAPSNSNVTVSTQPSPSPTATASPSPATTETAAHDVTLPLLDALLTDDKFVARVKQNLKLSDQQIEDLKRVSSEAVTRLRENNAEDVDTDGTGAPARAEEQLRATIGEEKARQLTTLANEYWSKGDTSEIGRAHV